MPADVLLFAQQTMPTFDGMYWINLLSRILHILGAIILLGGLIYLRAVVMPSPTAANATTVDEKFGGLRAKWAMWIGIATALLLLTGLWNFVTIIRHYDVASSYQMIFGLKFLAAIVLFVLAALVAGRTHAAEVVRSKMRMWVGIAIAVGVLAVALGGVLRSYPHNPKVGATVEPAVVAPDATNQ